MSLLNSTIKEIKLCNGYKLSPQTKIDSVVANKLRNLGYKVNMEDFDHTYGNDSKYVIYWDEKVERRKELYRELNQLNMEMSL